MKNAAAGFQTAPIEPGRKWPSAARPMRPLTLSEAHALWTQKGGARLRSARAEPLEQSSPPRARVERTPADSRSRPRGP